MPVHRPHQFGPHHLHLCREELWEIFRQHLQHHAAQDLGRRRVRAKLDQHREKRERGKWYEKEEGRGWGRKRVTEWEYAAIKIMAGGRKRE